MSGTTFRNEDIDKLITEGGGGGELSLSDRLSFPRFLSFLESALRSNPRQEVRIDRSGNWSEE